MEHRYLRSAALVGIFLLLLITALYLARGFLLPIVISMVASLLLAPPVRGLTRLHIPEPAGAALVLVGAVLILGLVTYRLAAPASAWLEDMPEQMREAESRLRNLKAPVQKMAEATQKVEEMTEVNGDEVPAPSVRVESSRFANLLLSRTRSFLATAAVVVILVYFLLASGDHFLRRFVEALPRLEDKRRAVIAVRTAREHISHYLLVLTLINLGLAIAVSGSLALLGMPNPILWGVLAGALNFVPFLGPIVTFGIIALASVLSFESLGHALLVPLVYGAINFVEGSFVTPTLLGQRLVLHPVAIFVSLMFWGWLWGIPGALLAVPMLATIKIVCDQIPPLNPIASFLGAQEDR